MQCCERQLHLRLAARGTHHPAPRRLPDQVLEQRCLAHARFARHDQGSALTSANSFDQPVEDAALGATVNWLHRAALHPEVRPHLHRNWRQPTVEPSALTESAQLYRASPRSSKTPVSNWTRWPPIWSPTTVVA